MFDDGEEKASGIPERQPQLYGFAMF